MQAKGFNHYVIFIASAFAASMYASVAMIFDTTSEVAIATSVLYLIPGVPLINGVIDIVEGACAERYRPPDVGADADRMHRRRIVMYPDDR